MPKKSPKWMDELLEREKISWEEYYARVGLDRPRFWQMYWEMEKVLEEWRGFWQLVELGELGKTEEEE